MDGWDAYPIGFIPVSMRSGGEVRKDPVGFARIQWDTWSPPGWFDETEFAATSESFLDPDWVDIT